jgi:hypothetical protein
LPCPCIDKTPTPRVYPSTPTPLACSRVGFSVGMWPRRTRQGVSRRCVIFFICPLLCHSGVEVFCVAAVQFSRCSRRRRVPSRQQQTSSRSLKGVRPVQSRALFYSVLFYSLHQHHHGGGGIPSRRRYRGSRASIFPPARRLDGGRPRGSHRQATTGEKGTRSDTTQRFLVHHHQ